jgi:hypothetical protein
MTTKICLLILITLIAISGCTSTKYLTDKVSIDRQHDMRRHRTGGNVVDVLLNLTNIIISSTLNSEFEPVQSERAFKKISIQNQSRDSLFVNMVTDVLWKDNEYCDIMGIVLPTGAKQRILVPYPAAYNVYFRTPNSEEEHIEIRTDSKTSVFKLQPRMTNDSIPNKSN